MMTSKTYSKSHWSELPDGSTPNVYIARSPWSEDCVPKYIELATASNDPDRSMPVCQAKRRMLHLAKI